MAWSKAELAEHAPEAFREAFPGEDPADALAPPPADPKRSAGGRKAKKRGDSFEKRLRDQHERYRAQDIVTLEPLNMPMRRLGSSWTPTGDAPYDFGGVLGSRSGLRGHAMMIEAKSSTARRPSLAIKPPKKRGEKAYRGFGLGIEQIRTLGVLYREWGAVVGVVWENGDQVGVLRQDRIAWALEGWNDARRVTKIPAEQFFWLNPGRLDYIGHLIEYAKRRT